MINKVSDLFPDAAKIGWRARRALRRAGWTPTRCVDVAEWKEKLVGENWPVSPEVEMILKSYGGLSIELRWCGFLQNTLELDPYAACDFEEQAYIARTVEPYVVDQVCIIGVWDKMGSILIGRKGVYLCLENGVAVIGHCWMEALETLLSSGSSKLVWRSCIDDRSDVILDGIPGREL